MRCRALFRFQCDRRHCAKRFTVLSSRLEVIVLLFLFLSFLWECTARSWRNRVKLSGIQSQLQSHLFWSRRKWQVSFWAFEVGQWAGLTLWAAYQCQTHFEFPRNQWVFKAPSPPIHATFEWLTNQLNWTLNPNNLTISHGSRGRRVFPSISEGIIRIIRLISELFWTAN